jgi:hypothetical protein
VVLIVVFLFDFDVVFGSGISGNKGIGDIDVLYRVELCAGSSPAQADSNRQPRHHVVPSAFAAAN